MEAPGLNLRLKKKKLQNKAQWFTLILHFLLGIAWKFVQSPHLFGTLPSSLKYVLQLFSGLF